MERMERALEWMGDIKSAKWEDQAAFVRLVRLFEGELYQTAKTLLPSDEDRADAMQETILRAFQTISRVREPASFKIWLIGIHSNECKKMLQSRKSYVPHKEGMDPQISEEDIRSRVAMSTEPAPLPPIVRERMERLYASLPELASDRRRYVRHRRWRLGSSIALLLAIVVTVGLVTPTTSEWLKQLKGIGSSIASSGSAAIFEKQAVEDQGIKLTLNRVNYDTKQLAIGIRHEAGVEIRPSALTVSVNGTPTGNVGQSLNEAGTESLFTFREVLGELPDSFEIEIQAREIVDGRSGKDKILSGEWLFRTNVRDWQKDVRAMTYDPPLTARSEDTEISVTGVTMSPLTAKVTFELIDPEYEKQEREKQSNVILPEGEKILNKSFNFKLFDDRGVALEPWGTSASMRVGDGPRQYTMYYSMNPSVTGELRLSVDKEFILMTIDGEGVYGSSKPITSETFPLTSAYPITVDMGNSIGIVFKRMLLGDDKTVVDYEVKGDYPYRDIGWWVEDGEGLVSRKFEMMFNSKIRLGDEGVTYRMQLPAYPDPSKLNTGAGFGFAY